MEGDSVNLLTVQEVAKQRLKLCVRTVREYIKKGVLPVVRFGRAVRIDERDLARFIERRKDQR